jgi:hypothetical protein
MTRLAVARAVSEMGELQTLFYLVLLVVILVGSAVLFCLIGLRRLPALAVRDGHPFVAALVGLTLVSVILFIAVGGTAVVLAIFHVSV